MPSSSVSPEAGAMANDGAPSSIVLLAYPKIVFLYPTFLMAVFAACYTTWGTDVLAPTNTTASIINILFLDIFALNLYDRAIVDMMVKPKEKVKTKIW